MLIKCPECGKEVSDKATQCIHCGYPLNTGALQETNYSDINRELNKKQNDTQIANEIPKYDSSKICPICKESSWKYNKLTGLVECSKCGFVIAENESVHNQYINLIQSKKISQQNNQSRPSFGEQEISNELKEIIIQDIMKRVQIPKCPQYIDEEKYKKRISILKIFEFPFLKIGGVASLIFILSFFLKLDYIFSLPDYAFMAWMIISFSATLIGFAIWLYRSRYSDELEKYQTSYKEEYEKWSIAVNDKDAYRRKIAEEYYPTEIRKIQQRAANTKIDANRPRCPYCGSYDVEKLSFSSRAASVAMVGILSQKIGKQWKCKHCKSFF